MIKKLPSLNGLRAFSIICVLIAHVEFRNLRIPNTAGGQIGVTIFFVLSGFLITLLLLNEEANTGTIKLKNFFFRRALRIFPVYYFLLLIYFIIQMAGVWHIEFSSWLSSLTYTKYFFVNNQKDWETTHLWSLSVEEHFYLIWPFVFCYFKKVRNVFVFFVLAAVPLVRLMTNEPAMHLVTRADALMWGCFFAMHYPRLKNFIKSISPALLGMPFLLLVLCLVSKKLVPYSTTNFLNHVLLAFFGSFGLVTNVCIGFIILISVEFRNNIYFSVLNNKIVDYIGKISYSIYIWQQLFFSSSLRMLSHLPVNLICIFIMSAISYHFIEKPFLKLKRRFVVKSSTYKSTYTNQLAETS